MMTSAEVRQLLIYHLGEYSRAVSHGDDASIMLHGHLIDLLARVLHESLAYHSHRLTPHGWLVSVRRSGASAHPVVLRWYRPDGILLSDTPGLYCPPDDECSDGRLLCLGRQLAWLFGTDDSRSTWIRNPLPETWYDVATGLATEVVYP